MIAQIHKREGKLFSYPLNREIDVENLTQAQVLLLNLFDRPMKEDEFERLRNVVVKHLSEELDKEVERVVAEKGITEADYERLRNDHQRTPIK